jgi:uncharacterized protein (UPF0548 family)
MFILTKPDDAVLQKFVDECKNARFSYDAVGNTKAKPPAGYDLDHNRRLIGHGTGDFEAAKRAIDAWKMFDFDWVRLFAKNSPNTPGKNVAMVARHMGFYSINGCRVVYSLDEAGDIQRYGFAYGTLNCHNETGEERFSVELHSKTGEVWYDLYAFSKPKHPLARIGYFYSRYLQKEFAKASMDAMKRAVKAGPSN